MASSGTARLIGAIVLIAAVAGLWWWTASGPPAPQTSPPDFRVAATASTPMRADPDVRRAQSGARNAPPPAAAANTPDGTAPPDENAGDLGKTWETVNMDEVRKAMPDNLYWKLSAPTKDPELLKWRDAERARWNVEYGKILSGTATEEEIRGYYDQRARLSGDYVEFTTYLLDHYENSLPDQDVGLLKLARRLHLARLEEIPRKVEVALERKQKQDAARAAWLADQAEFNGGDGDRGD